MSFDPGKIGEFKKIFSNNWKDIRGFEGCLHVELLQDENDPSIFFTYSLWESEDHINIYRESALFKRVWSATKLCFNARPEAWTVRELSFDQ